MNGTPAWDPAVVSLTAAQARAIGYVDLGGESGCTGTLVAPATVLTASHCFYVTNPAYVRFVVGPDSAAPEEAYEATSWEEYPGYSLFTPGHDVAIVRLADDPARDGIDPIPAYLGPQESILGERIQAVGYGQTYDGDLDNTRRWWTVMRVTSETPLGIAVESDDESGTCFGDSGGPLLYDDPADGVSVRGVLSLGEDAECLGTSFYTRLEGEGNLDFIAGRIPADACEALGVDATGLCTSDGHARWCAGGVVMDRDCQLCDQECGWTGDALGFYCH